MTYGDLRCARCGAQLTAERNVVAHFGTPGACKVHMAEVLIEAAKNYSMWPSGWFGCWMQGKRGDAYVFDHEAAKRAIARREAEQS
jgi:hypothetical protein